MSIKAPGYNIEGSGSGGFVKNLADGTFTFDNAGSGGAGTGWELVEKKVIASDLTSITFSGLDGDTDEHYMLVAHETPLTTAGGDYTITMRPNGATTLQQTHLEAVPSSSGIRFTANHPDLRWRGVYQRAIGLVINTTMWFHAKSGDVRVLHTNNGGSRAPPKVFPSGLGVESSTGVWDDTSANITSIDIVASVAGGIATGSVYCLYKKSAENSGSGLQLIETIDVAAPTTSVSFAGLDGDTDKLYKLIWKIVKLAGPPDLTSFQVRPNGVTTGQSMTFGFHSSSAGHGSGTFPFFQLVGGPGVSIPIDAFGEMLIDAESNPAALSRYFNGTGSRNAPGFPSQLVNSSCGAWSDVATNITSLDIVATDASAIAPGSHFSLYRVNK